MKPIILLGLLTASLFVGCQSPPPDKQTQNTQPNADQPIVGGDSDEHGCKASAGYQWSALRQSCIRIFESGIRLDAQAAHLDKSMSAFVVFRSDTAANQAEVFLPGQKNALLFDIDQKADKGAGTWRRDSLTLTQWKGMYLLSNNKNTLLYQGHH